MMKPSSKIFLYCLYAIVALAFFLYIRFPSRIMKEILLNQLRQAQPEAHLSVDEISPTFPPGIKLAPLSVSYADIPVIRMDELDVTPRLLSLFGNNKRFGLQGSLGDGQLQGEADTLFDANERQAQITINLSRGTRDKLIVI